MRILLTNDDGIHARGLAALADAIIEADLGEVWVVAPHEERSAMSHALTLGSPLRIRKVRERWFSLTGLPTDCSYMAINHVMKDNPPDLLVSGVNHGANLGTDITYSGTVGAAMEGCNLGVTSLAVSSLGTSDEDLSAAAIFGARMARQASQTTIPEGTLLNLNVPSGWRPGDDWCVTTLGVRHYGRHVEERLDPRGARYYWIGGPPITQDDIPGSDCNAVRDGFASITPVHLDLTHYDSMDDLRAWANPK